MVMFGNLLEKLKRKVPDPKNDTKQQRDLHKTEVPLREEDGNNWALHDKKPRREINIDLFRKIKRSHQLKKAGKFFKSEAQIARKYNVSPTTVNLIGKARSFKHYKEMRRTTSRPEKK